ncbi:hypothetical protein GP486_003267 [Trichoglossum hirsutum]|uniref:Chromatin assembly factor 1 subunit A n=1 Tax=Trichoglossum hirsutum TaxID=265104 RepID=A0A9P8LDF5_9PEZI|nr:hypothetical protein GP486_003267 [Trichoglossum hirsutum]
MSTLCSTTTSPNPRKRACPDQDAEAEADIRMETADESRRTASPSSMSSPYSDLSSFTNEKTKLGGTVDDCSAGERLAGAAQNEVAQDQKASLEEVEDQSRAAPLASDKSLPHAKRKKLTFTEKQVQAQEKADKKVRREEERRRREEERRKRGEEKAEERRKKEEERDERKRAKEEEKRVKEEEKRLKEEEKRLKEEEKLKKADAKKDKSQMSLNAFISRSSTSASAARWKAATPDEGVESVAQPALTYQMPSNTDYQRTFAPFFVKPHVTMAPWNRWNRDEKDIHGFRETIDRCLEIQNNPDLPTRAMVSSIPELCHISPSKRSTRGTRLRYSVKEIIVKLTESTEALGTAGNPVKTASSSRHRRHYGPMETKFLKSIPMKYLGFHEDVRPPYWGTFTKQPSTDVVRSLSRNPTRRKLPNINYDYDSEAVWDPEEEGEDLDSEGEQEDASDDDADDMEGFLDDEGVPEASDTANRRRAVLSDLVPICSGLCWDDDTATSNRELNGYRMEAILTRPGSPSGLGTNTNDSTAKNKMNPPRLPLHSINRTNASASRSTSNQVNVGAGRAVMVAAGDLVNFKAAIQGSNLTKTGLVEVLKKQ